MTEPVFEQWHPVVIDFAGPKTSEGAAINPFLDYRLQVTFMHESGTKIIRGFYAADGRAAETSADSGDVWRVRFAPDLPGEWSYRAELRTGTKIALSDDTTAGRRVPMHNAGGYFTVTKPQTGSDDFRTRGRIVQDGRHFRFAGSGKYWLKGGANSPENLFGYGDIDGTYRRAEQARDGEASSGSELHTYAPHSRDWREGDPQWQGGKGKALIGALNYLADEGMNAVYLLTMNVDGDGNDVWPWREPNDPTRFDVSKLAQWDIVFTHMQQRGIMVHLVTQETENELMLDGGDTGPMRQLYYRELIARFAHHPALTWNLGEENGPVHWRPEGQDDAQRMAMADFIDRHDPYDNPILLHTHAEQADKDEILTPLLGHASLDGLSFQVSDPQLVNAETRKWLALSAASDRPWMITMDEIGPWHTGAKADVDDPTHDVMRRHALWGALLAGSAGVEWYFGARQKGNDLTTEDWRSRAELWKQTRNALEFFEQYLPYWEMIPCERVEPYCYAKPGEVVAVYFRPDQIGSFTLDGDGEGWQIHWFDPVAGGDLQSGSVTSVTGTSSIGKPPSEDRDWVMLARRTK